MQKKKTLEIRSDIQSLFLSYGAASAAPTVSFRSGLVRVPLDADVLPAELRILRECLVAVSKGNALGAGLSREVDCVEFAHLRADAAAEALDGVDVGRAAAEAAGGFLLELLLGEGQAVVAGGHGLRLVSERTLTRRIVKALFNLGAVEIVLVERREVAAVTAHREALSGPYEAVDGNGALLAGGDRVDRELRAGEDVAADEDVRLRGLVGEAVRLRGIAAAELYALAIEHAAPLDALADGDEHEVRRNGDRIVLVVFRGKFVVFVKDGNALFEDDAGDAAVRDLKFLRAPAVVDLYALALCFLLLLGQSGHFGDGLEAVHGGMVRALAHGGAGDIDGDIAAADHNDLSLERRAAGERDITQEVDASDHALGVLAGDIQLSAALRADGDIEGFKALHAELRDGNIPADLDAGFEFDVHAAQNVDLGVDNALFEAEVRDAEREHAADAALLFKDGHAVAVAREVVGAGEARRAGADDGDLLAVVVVFLRDEGKVAVELLVGDELFDLVDGDGLVKAAACALVFAVVRADAAANRRERVLALDDLEGLEILALGRLFYVALNGDVRGAGRLAGGGTGRHRVFAVFAVVRVPLLRAPLGVDGGLGLRDLDGGLRAELLAEFHGVVRAVFDARAAGDAVIGVYFRDKVRAGELRRVKARGDAEGLAGAGHAVAHADRLALLEGRDLVDTADLLEVFELFQSFLGGDRLAETVLDEVLGRQGEVHAHAGFKIALALEIARALVRVAAHAAALAGQDRDAVLVVHDELRGGLGIEDLRLGGDGGLDRDDAHDARAHRGAVGVVLHRLRRVIAEGEGDLRVLLAIFVVERHKLPDTGGIKHLHEHFHAVNRCVRDAAHVRKAHKRLVRLDRRHAGGLRDFLRRGRDHEVHRHHDPDLVVGDPVFKQAVLRTLRGDLVVPAADLLTHFNKVFSDCHFYPPTPFVIFARDMCVCQRKYRQDVQN